MTIEMGIVTSVRRAVGTVPLAHHFSLTFSLLDQTLYDSREGSASPAGERLHPEDRTRVEAKLDGAMKNKTPFHCEYRFRKKDGSYRFFEDNGSYLYDDSRQAVRMLGAVKGILPMAVMARDRGLGHMIVPEANAREAAVVDGVSANLQHGTHACRNARMDSQTDRTAILDDHQRQGRGPSSSAPPCSRWT